MAVSAEELRNHPKLDIVDVIEGYGYPLTKAGDEYRGAISPSSKSGKSLCVNRDKQVYDDKAGHAGKGDVFNFIAFKEGLDIQKDFPRVLKFAADMAGIPFGDVDPTEAADKRKLDDLFIQVAEKYHSNLDTEKRKHIRDKWGFTDETIDKFKIGYAPANSHLLLDDDIKNGVSKDTLRKSGLFWVNDGDKLTDIYRDRFIFPYWKSDKPVYFIGRDRNWNRDKVNSEGNPYPKFIKQLVHSEKRSYIHPSIDNSTLYGIDSIRGQDIVYITEGVADCIALLQAEIPCISPVTIQIKRADIDNVLLACKGKKLVKIINDNETNESGLNGAIDTAKTLESNGIRASIILLPRDEGKDKIDVAEYLLNHSKEELESLSGHRVWDIILNKLAPVDRIPEDVTDKIDLVKEIVKELSFMPEQYRKSYVLETVKDRLKIKSKNDIKNWYKDAIGEQPIEYASVEVTFLRGNGQVRTKKLSQHVMGLNHYITMKDNKDIYYYKDGVYVRGGEDVIRKDVQDILGDYSSEQRQKEIVNFIRTNTLVDRDEIGYDCTKINLLNGLYNRETEELEPHTPDYISIRQIPVNYDPVAKCDKIDKYMSEVLKPEDIQTVLEYFGYCLIPDTRMQKSLLVHGPGQGGKSVLLTVLGCAIGAINCSRESLHTLENDKYSVAELYGRLVNISPDLASATIYENEMFKQISGNEHKLRGERKFGHPFHFKNTARLVFSANDLPPVPKGNFAYFRRWMLVKMDTVIEDSKQDKSLADKLTTPEELSGLLNKTIAALNTLLHNGKFTYNHTVAEVEEQYLIHSDPIAAFAKARLTYSDGYVLKRDVLAAYVEWCGEHNKVPVYEGQLSKKLIKHGYRPGRLPESQGHMPIWHNSTLKNEKTSCIGNDNTDKIDRVQGSHDNSTGFQKQPCTPKALSSEQPYRVTGVNTPIETKEKQKNKSSYHATGNIFLNNTCTIGVSNPVTLYGMSTDGEKAVQGCTSEPCTPKADLEEWMDTWEKSNGLIFGKKAIKATMDIANAKGLHSSEFGFLEAAVKERSCKRCVDCGNDNAPHITVGEGLRCNECHKPYANRPLVVLPDELDLSDPTEEVTP